MSLETLAEQGIHILDISKVHSNVRDLLETPISEGGAYFPLYGEKDAVAMTYLIHISEEVKKYIKQYALQQIKDAFENEEYDNIQDIVNDFKDDFHLVIKGPSWVENPAKLRDAEYLKDLALKLERALPQKELVLLQKKYGFKLKPVVSTERFTSIESNENKKDAPIYRLIVTYHLNKS